MRFRTAAAAALAAGLLVPAGALAQEPSYPEPSNPGKVAPKPKGKGKTRTVCKKGCRFRTIQSAVNRSKAGDTVKVKRGTYRETVTISGRKKSYLKLLGTPRRPGRVVLEGGDRKRNGVLVTGADQVTVRGIKAQNYTSNGFFFVNVVGYTAQDLIAAKTGVYGIYAFNSKGGTMRDSEAYYNNDAGFYIGQTPAQVKPVRSIVDNIESWGNPLGWSGTNMRYVTITNSRFYNNAAGLIPNALDSEKFPPAEDNIIRGNEIFWNNFNFHRGAPFKIATEGTAALAPVGTGVLLLAGRRNVVEDNEIYGNWGIGVALIEGVLLEKNPQAVDLIGNEVRNNRFGLGGTDLNGRELAYDGNGSDNCFGGNAGVSVTIPADGSTLSPCPFDGANPFNQAALGEMLGLTGEASVAAWKRHEHAPKQGYTPLELFEK
jgi:Periplasmic copper-binding protein (NosD)